MFQIQRDEFGTSSHLVLRSWKSKVVFPVNSQMSRTVWTTLHVHGYTTIRFVQQVC